VRTFFAGCLVYRRHIVCSAVRMPCVCAVTLDGRVRLGMICGVKRSGFFEHAHRMRGDEVLNASSTSEMAVATVKQLKVQLRLKSKNSIELRETNYGNPDMALIYETSNILGFALRVPATDCPQNKVLVGKGRASHCTTCTSTSDQCFIEDQDPLS
jgi:hypothetical protein